MIRIWRGGLSRLRNIAYRALGVRMHGYAWLQAIEIPRNHRSIELGREVALDRGVVLLCAGEGRDGIAIRIGPNTYINRHTFIDAAVRVEIGARCAIGPGCYITDHDHGTAPGSPPLDQPLESSPTTIGDEAWIGANATILKGVTIGPRAVVGAGSVVTKDVAPGSVVAGVPARVIRERPRGG